MLKKIKQNQKLIIAILAIVITLLVCSYFWWQAESWANMVTADTDSWYAWPELSRLEIRDAYNLAFKKCVLFAGGVFGSAALLIKAIEDKETK